MMVFKKYNFSEQERKEIKQGSGMSRGFPE